MTYRVVALSGEPHVRKSYPVNGTPKPGYLMDTYDNSGVINVRAHSAAGGTAACCLLLESRLVNKGTLDAATSGDQVEVGYFLTGEEVAVWLKDGQVATPASHLESNGDGTFRVVVADNSEGDIKVHSVLLKALESLSPSGADGQIKAVVI